MKPPVIYRFQKQNYPGSPDWFTRFMQELNQFTETIFNMTNNNINLVDNIDAQIYSFNILAGAAATNNTISFNSTLNHTPQTVIVGNCVNAAAYGAAPSSAVQVFWNFSSGQIHVTSIVGLTSGQTYKITLRIE